MPQSLSNVVVHLIFSTAHRDPSLTPEVQTELFPYMAGILKNQGCTPVAIGGFEDHAHLLFATSRTKAPAAIVQSVKGGSSGWIKERFAGKRDFAWQAGYGIYSIGRSEVKSVTAYINNQEEHHKHVSFQDEFRELMRLAGIEIDERYVWE